MSTLSYAISDTATLTRRAVKHIFRYWSMTMLLVMMPVIFLLLFVYVFGGTIGAGLGGGRDTYINYVVPGIILMTIAASANGTAVSVSMDMTSGIIARFRTMAVGRGSVLAGRVLGATVQTLFCMAIVLAVALAVGFRPTAGPLEWLALIGVLAIITLAMTWLVVALGLVAKTVESASNLPTALTLLPFLSSGFVPTDSMPTWLGWFAEYQPFTPFIETVRGLLMGTPIGDNGWLTIAWSVVIMVLSFLWAVKLFNRNAQRAS
jgi:ABC-2 type transport system permease protein